MNLNAFSLEKLKHRLKTTRTIPSQKILLEDIDHRFARLKAHGIENLAQLQKALKTKSNVESFSKTTGLPLDYLTVLRREVNGYHPKPIKLSEFPGVNPDAVNQLEQVGIKNTKQLFPHILTPDERSKFAEQNQIEYDDILDLTGLTEAARLKWVGPKFARLLVESGYDSVEKVANSDFEELYQSLVRINEEKDIYRGKFGLEDMKVWVNVYVQDVPQMIEFVDGS